MLVVRGGGGERERGGGWWGGGEMGIKERGYTEGPMGGLGGRGEF